MVVSEKKNMLKDIVSTQDIRTEQQDSFQWSGAQWLMDAEQLLKRIYRVDSLNGDWGNGLPGLWAESTSLKEKEING